MNNHASVAIQTEEYIRINNILVEHNTWVKPDAVGNIGV